MIVSLSPLQHVDLRYTDRDVIRARRDVPTSDSRGAQFTPRLTVAVERIPVSVPRG